MTILPDGQKRCPHCGETKPFADWHRNRRAADGLASWCKACCLLARKAERRARPVVMEPDIDEGERWLPVGGYEGLYEVSCYGRVRRIHRRPGGQAGHVLRGVRIAGYLQVHLARDGTYLWHRVHRLVAAAFLGPCPAGIHVNHKDLCRHNNRLENLEYVTPLENARHAVAAGVADFRGERGPGAKFTNAQAAEIRAMRGLTQVQLAARYGVNHTTIGRLLRGQSYTEAADLDGDLA
jgi:hypothetical protein